MLVHRPAPGGARAQGGTTGRNKIAGRRPVRAPNCASMHRYRAAEMREIIVLLARSPNHPSAACELLLEDARVAWRPAVIPSHAPWPGAPAHTSSYTLRLPALFQLNFKAIGPIAQLLIKQRAAILYGSSTTTRIYPSICGCEHQYYRPEILALGRGDRDEMLIDGDGRRRWGCASER